MQPSLINIEKLKKNPNNPRIIKDDKFSKLVTSIQEFPEMLKIRPIVYADDFIVLGGNIRLEAAKAAGLKEIWAIDASELTSEQKREFIIKDNVGFGEWDWDILANEWDVPELEDWGLEFPVFHDETDYAGKNKEIDVDDFSNKMTINLEYTEDDYHKVKDGLSRIASTPEMAIWKLLGYE